MKMKMNINVQLGITLIILDGRDRWLGGKAESDSYRHRSSSPERYRAGPGHGGGAGGVASHRSRLVNDCLA